jgi:hypothetical protein
MTMTPERLAELDAAVARFPVSLPWIFTPTERDGVTGIHGEPHPVGDKFAVAYLADVFGDAAPVIEVMNAYPDLRAHIDALAATIARVIGAAKSLLALCEQAGLADDLLATIYPDSKNRSGQTRDETAKQARRTMNEARAAIAEAAVAQ